MLSDSRSALRSVIGCSPRLFWAGVTPGLDGGNMVVYQYRQGGSKSSVPHDHTAYYMASLHGQKRFVGRVTLCPIRLTIVPQAEYIKTPWTRVGHSKALPLGQHAACFTRPSTASIWLPPADPDCKAYSTATSLKSSTSHDEEHRHPGGLIRRSQHSTSVAQALRED